MPPRSGRPDRLLEVHIEQGPPLEAEDLPLGVVTAIAGQTGATVTFSGVAGHAGTVPMALRRDALSAAAEWILAAERSRSRRWPGRDGRPATRRSRARQRHPGPRDPEPRCAPRRGCGARSKRGRRAAASARKRSPPRAALDGRMAPVQETSAVASRRSSPSRWPKRSRQRASRSCGCRAARATTPRSWRAIAPVAMLFVRCAGGISHNPAEAVTAEDVAARSTSRRRLPRAAADELRPHRPRRDRASAPASDDAGRRRRRWRDRRPRPGARRRRAREIDATGLHLLPGVVDAARALQRARPHGLGGLRRPGRAALAAGGATAVVDMPLNAHPPTVDGAGVRRASAPRPERSALVDFALWGGLVPGDIDALDELAARGVVGFKAFMSDAAIDDFPSADDLTLYEGMCACGVARAAGRRARRERGDHGRPGAARARRGPHAACATTWRRGRPSPSSRRSRARFRSPRRRGCALHVVHVSTGRGVALVAEARARGVDVELRDLPALPGAHRRGRRGTRRVAKCAPPLRPRDGGRGAVGRRSPTARCRWSHPTTRRRPGRSRAPTTRSPPGAGSPAARRLLALLLDDGHRDRGLALELLARRHVAGSPPAASACLARGGSSRAPTPTSSLVDLTASEELSAADLHYRHRHSPFLGRRLSARVARTLVRGRTVFADGRIVGPPAGRLLVPTTTEMESP